MQIKKLHKRFPLKNALTPKRSILRIAKFEVLHVNCFSIIDPRFDGLSGKFNYDLFRKSYKFIEEKQEEELKEMKDQMYKEDDDKEKRAIQVYAIFNFYIG